MELGTESVIDRRGGATVMVVDDNEQNRLVAEAYLHSFGYDVVLTEDGQSALEALAARPIDLVLLDIQMPVLDGIECCRRMRQTSFGERVPIVFMTAFGDPDIHARAMEAGADDFLMKPIQRAELLIRVRSLIRLKTLQHELQGSLEVIRQQNLELVRAQERRRMLTAMIVHDLKTPLSGVVMNGHWLLDVADLHGERHEAMVDIIQACESMRRMIMDLLDVDRSETGELVPHRIAIAPVEIVDACVRDLRARARAGSQSIVSRVEDDVPTIRADRDLLLRTLVNITENAIKFAPLGTDIHLEARRHGDSHVRFSVRDQGPGIPEDKRSKVFDAYARLDRDSDVHAHDSRGLGLTFCRLAVEAHGGRLWVEDGRPTGTVFCIELPI